MRSLLPQAHEVAVLARGRAVTTPEHSRRDLGGAWLSCWGLEARPPHSSRTDCERVPPEIEVPDPVDTQGADQLGVRAKKPVEVATEPVVIQQMDTGAIDLAILDSEAVSAATSLDKLTTTSASQV